MAAVDNRRVRLVVVGHVDHGKSTLIGRLLLDTGSVPADRVEEIRADGSRLGELDPAFVTDSLREERTRSVTIDTAQVFLRTPLRDYAIIDTPGHRQFLKNMFTGATRADAAVLVVDAVEGIREQTVRHAEILRMIGVEHLLVAVNKMDAVGFDCARFEALSSELEGLLGGVPAGRIDIKAPVPVSAREGDNVARRSGRMGWYSGPTFLDALDGLSIRSQADDLPLRMPVQDVYQMRGRRIFVGRVESGRIGAGDRVMFQPSGRFSFVESLRKPGQEEIQEVKAGRSVGLHLTDGFAVGRGEVICHEDSPISATRRIEALVFWFSGEPLAKGARLVLRCATQEVGCTVGRAAGRRDSTAEPPGAETHGLKEGELGTAVLATDRPIAVERFRDIPQLGRFVLAAEDEIVGAGIVISQENPIPGPRSGSNG